MKKYEVIKIDDVEVSLDLSMFHKTEELWFNATDVAKHFGKEAKEWLKRDEAKGFFEALIRAYPYLLKNSNRASDDHLELQKNRYSYIVKTTRGRYGGTLLHRLCAFEFGRWCSKDFAVAMDRELLEFIRKEQYRKMGRLEAKTGYRPLTDAIMEAHNPTEFYHYTNEADMINRIITGKTAKQLKEEFNTKDIRECMCVQEIKALVNLQRINTALIQLGHSFQERKEQLQKVYKDKFSLEAVNEIQQIEE